MGCNCNQQTNYNICNPAPCQEPQDCSCPTILKSDCVTYSGDDLECSGIKQGTILTELIQQLDAFICQVRDDLLNAFSLRNIGAGAKVYKGDDLLGRKELRTVTKTGDLITVTENTNDIAVSIDESALNTFIEEIVLDIIIEENDKTYSVDNVGTGVEIYKDSTVVGDNTQFNLKSLKLSQLGGGAEVIRELQDSSDEILFINRTLVSDSNSIDITVTDNTISLDINNTWLISFLQSNSNTLCEIFSNCTGDPIIEQGNFGYSLDSEATACLNSCTSTDLVQVYRDNVFGRFEQATMLSTDLAMTISAPVGYYAEFSTELGDSVVRYWNGSNLGVSAICGCPV